MSRRSGYRLSVKDMRHSMNPEHVPTPQEPGTLWLRPMPFDYVTGRDP